jgi:hypothetical protein
MNYKKRSINDINDLDFVTKKLKVSCEIENSKKDNLKFFLKEVSQIIIDQNNKLNNINNKLDIVSSKLDMTIYKYNKFLNNIIIPPKNNYHSQYIS